jgi:hypothetical protein
VNIMAERALFIIPAPRRAALRYAAMILTHE